MSADEDVAVRYEFAVQMTCGACVQAVTKALEKVDGIQESEIDLEGQGVTVVATARLLDLLAALESTGMKTVVLGMGGTKGNLGAAVAILKSDDPNVHGVVRFIQLAEKACLIDATVAGLTPGKHGFHIHEFGDWSNGCINTGGHYNPGGNDHGGPDDDNRHAGDLGNIEAGADGVAVFRTVDRVLNVWDIIGRGIVVHAGEDDLGRGGVPESKTTGNAGGRVACGTIARSAGVFENTKRICKCNGTTIWEEDDLRFA
ncbi:uncharacterized protein AMSG_04097 [Thecamonas trahens ATCC 50062]|uniref:Superoxide dismutase copper chaperone n=1 Tax=Thecamonas trahens ATCC 50062 TaxID=461836 RepID=A0A0L0D656_THETB|nr:hypothetical protein AMSG_04097 [Thecamonas trahens ATCC 50062]KNC47867.1 hypothetical protein AMSG_04097 [Thecamonas trahens ATCC 50062]|eukprot:XP_013759345.1 hypothetical protein AMSG_04097 [Thecamonas trahens ATCC 50062]